MNTCGGEFPWVDFMGMGGSDTETFKERETG